MAPMVTREHAETMRHDIDALANSLIDEMIKEGCEKPVDLVEKLALPLPSYVSLSAEVGNGSVLTDNGIDNLWPARCAKGGPQVPHRVRCCPQQWQLDCIRSWECKQVRLDPCPWRQDADWADLGSSWITWGTSSTKGSRHQATT